MSKYVEMTESRRGIILAIASGDLRTLPYLHLLDGNERRDQIFSWLLKNGIKGKKLYDFFQEHSGSYAEVIKKILSGVESDKRRLLRISDL